MSENPTIVLDGDVSPFRQKMREAAADLKKFGDDGKNSFEQMSGPLEALRSKFIAIGALLAGGKVFSEAINSAKEFYGETGKLSKAFGISEEGAIALKIALGDLYIDTDTATGAVGRLTMVMNTAPEKFAQLGVAISDSSGKSRSMISIMLDVVARINEYAEGTDRARAMAYMFGKSWQDVQKIMSLTNDRLEEAAAKARELGIEIRGDDIREYRAAMNDVNDVFEAMNVRIGTALFGARAPAVVAAQE